MSETNMPAVEATSGDKPEFESYELAFHILPTIAEGEVKTVFEGFKAHITKLEGTVTLEELPARFELAYDVIKVLEGRNRKFSSAYFGWIRFTLEPNKIGELTEIVEGSKEILRHLLIRLTKMEDANPFYFHPAIADRIVETVVVEEEVPVTEVVAQTEEKVEGGEGAAETV